MPARTINLKVASGAAEIGVRRRCKWPESLCTTVSGRYVAAAAFLVNVSGAMPRLRLVSIVFSCTRTPEGSNPLFIANQLSWSD